MAKLPSQLEICRLNFDSICFGLLASWILITLSTIIGMIYQPSLLMNNNFHVIEIGKISFFKTNILNYIVIFMRFLVLYGLSCGGYLIGAKKVCGFSFQFQICSFILHKHPNKILTNRNFCLSER